MRIRATVYRPVGKKRRLGKVYTLDERGLPKAVDDDFEHIYFVAAEVAEWSDLVAYHDWLTQACTLQLALTYAMLDVQRAIIFIEDKDPSQRKEGIRRREKWYDENPAYIEDFPPSFKTNKHLSFVPGSEIIFAVDSDPTPKMRAAGIIRNESEVWDDLCHVWPALRGQAYISAHSSSTWLSVDGELKVAEKGVRISIHTLLDVDAAPSGTKDSHGDDFHGVKLENYAKILHKRLIIAGRFSPFISSIGVFELRTVIDLAVTRPSQPDFIGAPTFADKRITQDRPAPVFHAGRLDPIRLSTIKPLSEEDEERFREIVTEQKVLHDEEIKTAEDAFVRSRASNSPAVKRGDRSVEQEMKRLRAAGLKYLPIDSEIKMRNGSITTGEKIVANPEAYVGNYCHDPYRPEKGGSKAKIIRITRFNRRVPAIKCFIDGRIVEFVDDADLQQLMEINGIEVDDGNEDRKSDEEEVRGRDGGEVYAPHAAMAMRVQPPPPEDRRPDNFPVYRSENVLQAAHALIADTSDGVKIALGFDMEVAAAEEFFRTKKGTVPVKSYEEAAMARMWIKRVRPDAKVMIMPSRVVDVADKRSRLGDSIFSYIDEDGNTIGCDDVVCYKPSVVDMLHDAGLDTIASLVCHKPASENGPAEYCAFYNTCGLLPRMRSRGRNDFVIEMIAGLAGTLNPLLEGDEKFSADVLIPSQSTRPTASGLEWHYRYWTQHPEVAVFLPFIERGGPAPSFADVGSGSKARLEAWAGMPAVSPNMTESASLDEVMKWGRRTEWMRNTPSRLKLVKVVKNWIEGKGGIRIDADKVTATLQAPPKRLEDTSAIALTSSKATAKNMLARLAGTAAGAAGATTVAAKRSLPTKIIQIVPNGDGLDAAESGGPKALNSDGSDVHTWLKRNADGAGSLAGPARDLQELIKQIARERGPGIVMAGDGVNRMSLGPDVQVVTFTEMSLIFAASGALRQDATWAFVIGHRAPANAMIRDYICSQDISFWPRSVEREDGLITYDSRAIYTKRDGTPHDFEGGWRKTGSDAQTDQALQALVADPVITLAGAVAKNGRVLGKGTLLVIVDRFPLVDRNTPLEGVPADLVLRFRIGIPSAAMIARGRGLTVDASAAAFHVHRDTVRADIRRNKDRGVELLRLYAESESWPEVWGAERAAQENDKKT